MKPIGKPTTIQNTDSGQWIVHIEDAVTSSNGEGVTFTVMLPRDVAATVPEIQQRAVQRAIDLLQGWLALKPGN